MATITYRALSPTGDMTFGLGNGQGFLVDVSAIAQSIKTRLLLFQGEWWLDQNDGLPLWQNILGQVANVNYITLLIQDRIISTPYVSSISNLSTSFNAQTRQYSFTAQVNTTLGVSIVITNVPVNLPPV